MDRRHLGYLVTSRKSPQSHPGYMSDSTVMTVDLAAGQDMRHRLRGHLVGPGHASTHEEDSNLSTLSLRYSLQPAKLTCRCTPTFIQTPLQTDTENFYWGDSFQKPKPLNTFCLFSKNVNTLSTNTDYLQWKATAHVLQQYKVDALAVQETNLAWNKPTKHRI